MRRVGRARRLQVCGRRLGRHLPSGLTAAEPSPTASRSIMYSKQIDDHAIGDFIFLKRLPHRPGPQGLAREPRLQHCLLHFVARPFASVPRGGRENGRPCPKASSAPGWPPPRKGALISAALPTLPGSGQGGGQGWGAPSACRAGAQGGPGPRFLEQGGAAVPSGQRWTSEDPKAGSAPRPHPSRPPLAPCAGRPGPGIMLQPKRF